MSLDFTITENNEDGVELWWRNITHNVNKMADKCGLYKPLWCANEYESNKDIVEGISSGIKKAIEMRWELEAMNPENGWGSHKDLLLFAYAVRDALIEFPHGIVHISK